MGSSNFVANEARAPLVARMDADDVCHPRRLECELRALAAHPRAVLVGALFDVIDGAGRPMRAIDRHVLLGRPTPPIAHSTILYRKWAFDEAGGYAEGSDYFEDADLYRRIARTGDILIIAEGLLSYRFAATSARLVDDRAEVEEALNAMPAALGLREPRPEV